MKKDDLIRAIGLYVKAGVAWNIVLNDVALDPADLNKNELVAWLADKKEKHGVVVEVTDALIAEKPELIDEGKEVGDVYFVLTPSGAERPAPTPQEPPAPPAPVHFTRKEDHTAEAVRLAASPLYYHGVRILSCQDQLIGHRIYKDIVLENGVGYKLTLEEFKKDVTAEKK